MGAAVLSIRQGVGFVMFSQDANHKQELVYNTGYWVFAFYYGSTLAPPVNTPVSPPIQPVSLPYNNNNSTGNFKGSRGIAPFIAIFPSRFQWWEHKHGRDVCSFVLPVFRYACYALAYFNSSFAGPLVVSTLPATSSTPLPVVVGGSCGGTTRSVSSMFPSLNKAFVVGLSYAPVLYKLVSKNLAWLFVDLADLLPDNVRAQEVEPQALLERKLVV